MTEKKNNKNQYLIRNKFSRGEKNKQISDLLSINKNRRKKKYIRIQTRTQARQIMEIIRMIIITKMKNRKFLNLMKFLTTKYQKSSTKKQKKVILQATSRSNTSNLIRKMKRKVKITTIRVMIAIHYNLMCHHQNTRVLHHITRNRMKARKNTMNRLIKTEISNKNQNALAQIARNRLIMQKIILVPTSITEINKSMGVQINDNLRNHKMRGNHSSNSPFKNNKGENTKRMISKRREKL